MINNIYTLNYVVKKDITKGNICMLIVATFVDLKAAFNSVDKGVLGRSLEERGVSVRLRKIIMEIYEKTRSVVRVGEKVGKKFWTEKGVRQWCSMLFNLLLADIKEGDIGEG